MERASGVIKSWVPRKVVVPLLIVIMFPHLMLLSMFSLNSTFTSSFLDIESDDLQFMFSMAYGLIVCGLFVHTRLFSAANVRTYLLIMTMLNIVVLFCMTITTNIQVMLVLRFIQAPLMLFEGCILLPILMSQMKSKNAKFIGYTILYAFMMTSDKFSLSIVKFAIENYSHNMIVYIIIIFHIITLFFYLFLFNDNRMFPKKPLYQLNLGGVFLLAIALISGAFFLVYGKRLNWFDSAQIVMALAICFVFSGLFLLHQKTSKRPLYHFDVLKSKRVVFGILIFFCFYLLRSGMSNIYQIMGSVWKWPWEYILHVQYINVAGSILGCIISYILFARAVSYKIIFAVSFLLLSICMLWFSYLCYPDTAIEAIGTALFLQGLGQGILFTPLVFYMIGSVHPSISGHAAQAGTATRFWTTTFGFALMQNLLWHLTTKYEHLLTKNLDLTNPIFQQEWSGIFGNYNLKFLYNDALHISVLQMKSNLAQQALLVANMEIFRGMFVFGMLVFIGIVVYRPLQMIFNRR